MYFICFFLYIVLFGPLLLNVVKRKEKEKKNMEMRTFLFVRGDICRVSIVHSGIVWLCLNDDVIRWGRCCSVVLEGDTCVQFDNKWFSRFGVPKSYLLVIVSL